MRVSQSGEERSRFPHGQDELSLAYYTIQIVPRLGFPNEIQTLLGLAPHLNEVVSSRKKIGQGMVAAVTGENDVARFDSRGEGSPNKVERGRDRLRPNRSPCHVHVDPRLVSGKSIFLGEIDTKPSKTVGVGVAVKGTPEDVPERCIAMRRSADRPVLQTQIHDIAGRQQKQVLIGEER